jgi:hypothetical protein
VAHFISKLLIPFLKGMNWSDLAGNISVPFAPTITNELDVSNFDDKFTQMIPADLRVSATLPPNCDKICWEYSCVSPVLRSEYVV